MTEMRQAERDYAPVRSDEPPPATGWVGWVLFAGVMLFMIGTFQAIAGLVALLNDKYYLVTSSGLMVSMDYTAWGWIHLGLGVIAGFAGAGVVFGQMWARVFGIGVAFLSALANLAFMGAYPVWSVVIIAIDVLAIYALAVHGREVKSI